MTTARPEAAGAQALGTYARARAWMATTAGLRVEEVRQLGDGAWALRTPQWPGSFVHNCLLLTTDPGPELALAWTEDAHSGLDHRHLSAYCALSPLTIEALQSAEYDVQHELVMVRPVADGPLRTPDVAVLHLHPDAPALNVLQQRLWREEWLPDASDATVAQLVDRRSQLDRAGPLTSLAVAVDGELVATMDVCIRDGIAEFDGLATLTAYRGRRFGQALFAQGTVLAAEAGCDLVILNALRDDWPQAWYARVGFTAVGPAAEATREPH